LAVARSIVEQHGGEIAVESAPGKGTEFIVSLPAAPMQPAAPLQSRDRQGAVV